MLDLLSGGELPLEVRSADANTASLATLWRAGQTSDPARLAELAEMVAAQRQGALRCTPTADGVEITNTIYLEGISRQSFTSAVYELGRAYEQLGTAERAASAAPSTAAMAVDAPAPMSDPEPEPEPVAIVLDEPEPEPEPEPQPEPMASEPKTEPVAAEPEPVAAEPAPMAAEPAPMTPMTPMTPVAEPVTAEPVAAEPVAAEPMTQPQSQPAAVAASAVPTPAATPTWTPTHRVPPAGMAAWERADPSAKIIAQLAAGLELQLVEQLGAWARVRASNGWTGWVDGRILQQR